MIPQFIHTKRVSVEELMNLVFLSRLMLFIAPSLENSSPGSYKLYPLQEHLRLRGLQCLVLWLLIYLGQCLLNIEVAFSILSLIFHESPHA